MGYDIHITRRTEWSDEGEPAISLSEWLDYVEADPEMRLDGHAEANLKNGSVLRMEDASMAVWIAHPDHGRRDGMAWIWLSHGNIQAKNPDDATLKKMWSIAQELGGRVQGDEGEHYDASGQMVKQGHNAKSSEPEVQPQIASSSVKKPWWRPW